MPADLVCFSHLRWDFVYQRPNHLMAHAARDRRVFFIEEPIVDAPGVPTMPFEVRHAEGVHIIRPHLRHGLPEDRHAVALRVRLDALIARFGIRRPVRWYYTPMAWPWSNHVRASAVVYDCMDELSAFRGAPRALTVLEDRLLEEADAVFTGGRALYLSKRGRHRNVHAFPSSVDVEHFAPARHPGPDPADQAGIARPRVGWFGVIDERFDVDLVRGVAERRPDWQFVLVGPVAKIDPATLPQLPNVHNLGPKAYDDLPSYVRGWDVAIMPFARNESTRFISPTKTPEYLAAGRPVVSTSIADVVDPYGKRGLIRIADDPDAFASGIHGALRDDRVALTRRADAFLNGNSWDTTWSGMAALVDDAQRRRVTRIRPAVSTARETAVPMSAAALEP